MEAYTGLRILNVLFGSLTVIKFPRTDNTSHLLQILLQICTFYFVNLSQMVQETAWAMPAMPATLRNSGACFTSQA